MGARKNKLCDQKGQDPKSKEIYRKKFCRGSKKPFQMYMVGEKKN